MRTPKTVRCIVEGALVFTLSASLLAQSPAFEVASVKLNTSGDLERMELDILPGGRFTARNVPLQQLILIAYGVRGFQLSEAPSWIQTERFDIDAKADVELISGTPPPQLVRLLAERFSLTTHKETRETPIYVLVLARSDGRFGPALRRSQADYCAEAATRARSAQPLISTQLSEQDRCMFRVGQGTLTAASMGMSTLAVRLSPLVRRVVMDRTGLDGVFDFDLTWTPDQGVSEPNTTDVSIFTALQEQLGLKLESTKGPVDVLVIDHVEHPTPD